MDTWMNMQRSILEYQGIPGNSRTGEEMLDLDSYGRYFGVWPDLADILGSLSLLLFTIMPRVTDGERACLEYRSPKKEEFLKHLPENSLVPIFQSGLAF